MTQESAELYNVMVRNFLTEKTSVGMGGGFFDDIFDFVSAGVEGLADCIAGAIESPLAQFLTLAKQLLLLFAQRLGMCRGTKCSENWEPCFKTSGP